MHKRIEIEMPSDAVLTTTSVLSPTSSAESSSLNVAAPSVNSESSKTAADPEETPTTEADAVVKTRKTVTFRNQLETSDDKDAVKKFYNPDHSIPLVSIIKKECLNRPMMYSRSAECIVRPSRLTEILKNNSNIDKLNSLKFRSTNASSSAPNVFGAGLFDVPEDDLKQEEAIAFHRRPENGSNNSEEDSSSDSDHNEAEEKLAESDTEADVKDIKPSCAVIAKQEQPEENEEDDEQQMIVDKHFVLPKRSNRSSRVIKPNKRLLDDGSICKKSMLDTKKELSKTVPKKEVSGKPKSLASNYFGLGKLEDKDKVQAAKAAIGKESESKPNFMLGSNSFGSSFGAKANNNFVLRQPRLQFEMPAINTTLAVAIASKLSPTLSPKFNVNVATQNGNSATSLAPSPPLSCCVCGSGIPLKNQTESKKYGVLSCESCRKFISKMTKKSLASSVSPLQCKGEGGNCSITAHLRNHIKNFKKIYKERCSACWLVKCIQSFQFPAGHKLRLNSILSASMIKQIETLKKQKNEQGAEMEESSLKVVCNGSSTTNPSISTNQLPALKKETEMTQSPTGGGAVFSAARLPAATTGGVSLTMPIKWKSPLEATTSESLKLNLKSNLLAENNVTFGSNPLLRPAVLEKPLFIKSVLESTANTQMTNQEISNAAASNSSGCVTTEVKSTEKTDKSLESDKPKNSKLKRKDKIEKDKTKDLIKDTKQSNQTKLSSLTVSCSEAVPEEYSSTRPSPKSSPKASELEVTQPTALSVEVEAMDVVPTACSTSPSSDKRQRIDIKGPRVKHVCRSASVALGQPLAMFGEDEEPTDAMENADKPCLEAVISTPNVESNMPAVEPQSNITANKFVMDENDNCTQNPKDIKANVEIKPPMEQTIMEPSPKLAKVELREELPKKPDAPLTLQTLRTQSRQHAGPIPRYISQLNKNQKRDNSAPVQLRRKEPLVKPKTLICIDFWENYDPAEVCQTGFGLIVTETVAQRALCFLCGSTGVDPLIFCACCCEPYHQYCVMDEYNLKHSSLDDTMLSLLDCSTAAVLGGSDQFAQISQRLNWLCPRCTVCYTCNMSSGSKVRCQKCQKNYHSTCLGTSKRLLGADRPLICVNCLKCKSCSTTKVSKFVGNLPMCTACFKLRKKGNYCPICQKCYEDNDFDLKMMECGECAQWVHSKCEGLSDEQYNILSTLPESIEFICKKCARKNDTSKARAQEWRQAVAEEFKNSLMSVLKLLSKSRQACALLKLSPRKKLRCICTSNQQQPTSGARMQPKALQFEKDALGSDGESQCSMDDVSDVYEFKDQPISDRLPSKQQPSVMCACQKTQQSSSLAHLSLVDIKKKISSSEYVSLAEFNYDMNNVIQITNCDELILSYKEILSEQFPWFQNETKACTDALEDDMFESCSYALNTNSMEAQHQFGSHQLDEEGMDLDLPENIEEVMYFLKNRTDSRHCLFCRKAGEGMSNEESRLLYAGQDCWVHTNCALWSAEVFEEIDGSLQNVHSAVTRGRMIKCTVCGNRGATVGCNVKSCGEHYHYACARSIQCAFMTDKSMYCPQHASKAVKLKPHLTHETNFEVARPVYVELDRKRKKPVEPSRVQFHIGSLEVKQLGTIISRFSDCYEALVPINFLCSRLYWSLKEPWKIVEYTIKTSIQNSTATYNTMETGRNFTVDHSNPNNSLVQLGLAQISRWHNNLSKGELMDCDISERSNTLSKLLPELLAFNQNSSTVPLDENTEEEPQTNADLLPPEIKDAIFEDLPHELLDGISMLDIFPKFMIYEEMGAAAMEGRTELMFSEHSKDALMSSSGTVANSGMEEDLNSCSFSVMNQTNAVIAANINHVEDALLCASRGAGMPQRFKAEILKNNQARTWSKLESSQMAAIKRRKLNKALPESMILSMAKKESVALSRRCSQSESNKNFTWSAAKHYMETEDKPQDSKLRLAQMDGVDDSVTVCGLMGGSDQQQFNGTVKCERCQCTYRNYESFQRHIPNCEPLSNSESESETRSNNTSPLANSGADQMPPQLHKFTQNTGMPFMQGYTQNMGLNQITSLNGMQLNGMAGLQGLQALQGLQGLQLQPQTMSNNFFLAPTQNGGDDLQQLLNNQAALQSLNANLGGNFGLSNNAFGTAQSQPQIIAVSTNPDGTQQIIQIPSSNTSVSSNTFQTLQATNSDKKIILPVGGGKPMKTMATKAGQQATKQKLKAANAVKPIQSKLGNNAQSSSANGLTVLNQNPMINPNLLQQMQAAGLATTTTTTTTASQPTQLLFQSNNATAQQPIMLQQLSAPQPQAQNIISFVTTAPDGSSQLQYMTVPATNEYKPQTNTQSFLGSNGLLQGSNGGCFLQTDAAGNLVLSSAPNHQTQGIQMLNLSQATQPQPQLIGTLIQPQTLQLGGNMLSTSSDQQHQQLIIGSNGGLEMVNTHSSPQIILAGTQPMYYGLETIVQNTVMSSQQFVSTAMPGVLSQNASFSATTTQVFQASKIEPLVDIPAGYVVLNNVDAGSSAMQAPTAQSTANFLNANLLQQQQEQQAQAANVFNTSNFQFPASNENNSYMEQQPVQINTAKIPPVTQMKRGQAGGISKVQPQQLVVNKVMPTSIAQQQHKIKQPVSAQQQMFATQQQQQRVVVSSSSGGLKSTTVTVNSSCNSATQQQLVYTSINSMAGNNGKTVNSVANKKTNLIRPINKAEVRPKLMKSSGTIAKPALPALQPQQQQTVKMKPPPVIAEPYVAPIQQIANNAESNHLEINAAIKQLPTVNMMPPPSNNVVNQEIEMSVVEPEAMESCPVSNANSRLASAIPTNIVNPIPQQATTRPTNRVLPMQQRQENNVSPPVVNNINSTVDFVASAKNNVKVGSINTKASFEAEVKIQASPPQESSGSLEASNPEVYHMLVENTAFAEHNSAEAYSKSLQASSPCYVTTSNIDTSDNTKCELSALEVDNSLSNTQMDMVTKCLMNEADKLMNSNDMNHMETEQSDQQQQLPQVEEEEEDEDGFSLKMPDDEQDQADLSDNDEPEVKQQISQILNNLTNEECSEAISAVEPSAQQLQEEKQKLEQQQQQVFVQQMQQELAKAAAECEESQAAKRKLEQMAENQSNADTISNNFMSEMQPTSLQLNMATQNKLMQSLPADPVHSKIGLASTNMSNETASSTVEKPTQRHKVLSAAPTAPTPPSHDPKKVSGPHLLYEIQSEDGFTYKSTSITEIWEKVFEAVQVARRAHGLAPLPEGPLADMSGLQMLGLKTNALKYLIEQLPGVEKCKKYTPKYHKRSLSSHSSSSAMAASSCSASVASNDLSYMDYGSDCEELMQESSHECARFEPYAQRSEYDMFSWLASRHRKQPIQVFVQPSDTELIPRRGTGSNLPMAMKYRTLKETYKDYVGVFRSHIHGRGLYCTKDIEAGEMVIEYAGELIRSTLTDKRERLYDSRGIGCYMFKIDDHLVVDATMRGNAARFINHSCEPNCYSKVVDILGHKHIIIFALRRIVQGEELTYDYKFPFEDEKIPCSCGSKRCRKYLN